MKFSLLIVPLVELIVHVCARPAVDDNERSGEYRTVASRACRDRCRQMCVNFGGQECIRVCNQQCAQPQEETTSVKGGVFKQCPRELENLLCLHGGVCYDSGLNEVFGRTEKSYGCMCAQCYRGARCESRLHDCTPVEIVIVEND
uniref:EGF-like domain-containing protein n=1 Tax=Plectus sambesii TaxID=2011161 RepID=A0A914W9U3_9BILA